MKAIAVVSCSVVVASWALPTLAQGQGQGLQAQVQALKQQVQTLQEQVATLESAVTNLQSNPVLALGAYVTVDPNAENGLSGPNVIFNGVNVHIESGSGSTVDATGLGNLVIGYDEDALGPVDNSAIIDANRTGSHNLVVGSQHQFTGSGGMIGGYQNLTSADYASVTGGACNAAGSAFFQFVSCYGPVFGADGSSVSGGYGNFASGWLSSVSAGESNSASEQFSSVSGGTGNVASGAFASVSGGEANTASGDGSSVGGGSGNLATGPRATVSGGTDNTASGGAASVGGGTGNDATGNNQNIN